jgi:hypothetical protein
VGPASGGECISAGLDGWRRANYRERRRSLVPTRGAIVKLSLTNMPFDSVDVHAEVAAQLAVLIQDCAGDYPLVSFRHEVGGPDLVWLYARLVVELFVVPGTKPRIRSQELGGVTLEVGSLQQGMTLLQLTEASCQRRRHPYVQLG